MIYQTPAKSGSSTISSRLDASNAVTRFTAANAASPVLAAQNAAKGTRRGLWSDPAPVPPWEWRAKAKK
jgi:endonuclease YncB( thermonuclease family)